MNCDPFSVTRATCGPSSAPTAPSSTRRYSPASGGSTLTATPPPDSTTSTTVSTRPRRRDSSASPPGRGPSNPGRQRPRRPGDRSPPHRGRPRSLPGGRNPPRLRQGRQGLNRNPPRQNQEGPSRQSPHPGGPSQPHLLRGGRSLLPKSLNLCQEDLSPRPRHRGLLRAPPREGPSRRQPGRNRRRDRHLRHRGGRNSPMTRRRTGLKQPPPQGCRNLLPRRLGRRLLEGRLRHRKGPTRLREGQVFQGIK